MYRYALRPRWILSHLFAAFVVVSFVLLGMWQLRRHDERAERNATVVARSELAPARIGALVATAGDDLDQLRYRQATASGDWVGPDLFVDNRSRDGLPGAWVLTGIELADGQVLVVNRGFLGFSGGDLDPPPPAGASADVVGRVAPWDGGCGIRTDADGDVVGTACRNREAAEALWGTRVLPVVLDLTAAEPSQPATLTPVPPPELDAGPHRSYAAQWFIFATIVAVVYVLILRKVAHERAVARSEIDGDGPAPDAADVTADRGLGGIRTDHTISGGR